MKREWIKADDGSHRWWLQEGENIVAYISGFDRGDGSMQYRAGFPEPGDTDISLGWGTLEETQEWIETEFQNPESFHVTGE